MGLFDRLVSKLTGKAAPVPAPTSTHSRSTSGITVTITGPDGPTVQVSDAQVAERVREHAFVFTSNRPMLNAADQWWNDDTHKRRRRKGPVFRVLRLKV